MSANATIVSTHFPTREARDVGRVAKKLGMTRSAFMKMMALRGVELFEKGKLRILEEKR